VYLLVHTKHSFYCRKTLGIFVPYKYIRISTYLSWLKIIITTHFLCRLSILVPYVPLSWVISSKRNIYTYFALINWKTHTNKIRRVQFSFIVCVFNLWNNRLVENVVWEAKIWTYGLHEEYSGLWKILMHWYMHTFIQPVEYTRISINTKKIILRINCVIFHV
jgi:hypothetical protein